MIISIDYDKDKIYKNHNRHSHVCRLYFSDESRNCTKFEYSCLRGNGTVCTVCGLSYFERMVYKTTGKGNYNSNRILLSVTVFVLLFLMPLMAASSVFATGAVFEWSTLGFNQFWQTVHLMSTSWGYMVMSFHLALHVHSLLKKLDGKVQSKIGKILLYIIYVLVILAGCFAFYKTQLYFYLFNTGNWKMVAENIVISYLEYTGITAAACGIYHLVKK